MSEPEGALSAERVFAQAALAVAGLAQQTTGQDQPFEWRLELDAPRWALKSDTASGKQGATTGLVAVLAFLVIFLGAAPFAVVLALRSKVESSPTALAALAIGACAGTLVLAVVLWRALATWRHMTSVHLDLRRTVPARVEITERSSASASSPTDATTTTTTTTQGQPATPTTTPPASPPQGPLSVVAKEPVLVGSTLLGGGTLALGLSGAVGGDALSAIVAAAIAAGGLLVRQLVTPATT